jgi:hypothetical protein
MSKVTTAEQAKQIAIAFVKERGMEVDYIRDVLPPKGNRGWEVEVVDVLPKGIAVRTPDYVIVIVNEETGEAVFLHEIR